MRVKIVNALFPLVCGKEGPQITFHAVTSSDDSVLTTGAKLWIQLVVTAAADEMTRGALHDSGSLGHVLKADWAFRVWYLRCLIMSNYPGFTRGGFSLISQDFPACPNPSFFSQDSPASSGHSARCLRHYCIHNPHELASTIS